MYILKQIKHNIKFLFVQRLWRNHNKHNFTTLSEDSSFDISRVTIGRGTYGKIDFETFYDSDSHLIIGSYCSIGPRVKFLLAGEHNYKRLSTYPFKFRYLHENCETFSKGNINIGDDVWIGYGAVILSGVTIGQGAVIGAGSIVRENVPPYSVFCNNSVKKYRFDRHIIDLLLRFDYSSLEPKDIKSDIQKLYLDSKEFCISDFYYERLKEHGDDGNA